MTIVVIPSWAWTPVGPWGGVVHDLVNESAESDTLFAATGNGIYQYPNEDPSSYLWDEFPSTLGMRVFEIVPDPANDRIFAIAVRSSDPFNFEEYLSPSGNLYMLKIVSDTWTDLSHLV